MKKDKEEQLENHDNELHEKMSKDFVVKNMPSLSSLSSSSYNQRNEQSKEVVSNNLKNLSSSAGEKQGKHQKTGILIIVVGLVFIIALFYLAYRFLILPTLTDPQDNAQSLERPEIILESVDNAGVIEPEEKEDDIDIGEVIIDDVVMPRPVIEDEPELSPDYLELPAVIDSDGDGLSDLAESFLGTDPYNSDTDGDGYTDKEEILAGYNPLGPGRLSDHTNLDVFVDSDKKYAVVYPKAWEVSIVSHDSVLFAAPDQDFIQISYEDTNRIFTNIIDWYEDQFSEVDQLTSDRFVISSFGPGIISADQQFAYFLNNEGSKVFVLSYIPAGSSMPYFEVFEMMLATFMSV